MIFFNLSEPFDRTNTARSVYDYETFERVKAVFVASWQVLKETLDLHSVFMPITDTSQTSSISDEDHSVRADSKTLPPKDKIDNRALSWTEDPVIVDSCSSTTKQMVKYRETKHMQTNCHNEMLYEPKVVPSAYRETSSNTSPPTFTSTSSSHSSSTTFASKHLNRNNNGTTALIS